MDRDILKTLILFSGLKKRLEGKFHLANRVSNIFCRLNKFHFFRQVPQFVIVLFVVATCITLNPKLTCMRHLSLEAQWQGFHCFLKCCSTLKWTLSALRRIFRLLCIHYSIDKAASWNCEPLVQEH